MREWQRYQYKTQHFYHNFEFLQVKLLMVFEEGKTKTNCVEKDSQELKL